MKGGVILILTAVGVFLLAVGCAMWSSPEALTSPHAGASIDIDPPSGPGPKLDGLPFRGIAMQVGLIDDSGTYEKCVDEIAALGADTIDLVVDSRQENGSSSVIFVDVRQSPTPAKLTNLIRYAHSKKLRVVMMPIVLLEHPVGTEWRGKINPGSWDEWFESYRQMILHYATIAEAGHADVFVCGSELVSTEDYAAEWLHTIHDVRRTYKGLVTYSANWDHYRKIPFWDHLDLVATNSYYKLGNDRNVSVQEIVNNWKAIQKDFLPWVRSQHKPYIFTEVGWCSVANAAHEPWDYTKESELLDLDLQRKLYEGFFKAWDGIPELGGFMIWEWAPNAGGPEDRGYIPKGKPAEKILREAFARPRWKVRVD